MERKRAGFTTTIIRHLAQSQKAAGAGDGDDMSVISLEHCRQKFAYSPVVRYGVDFKYGSNHALGLSQYRALFADAGVVDQHSWIAVVSADEGAGLLDAG